MTLFSHPFSFARWFGILLKEFIQLKRDRLTFGMIVGIPIMQLVLFGYAINADPKHMPTAVVMADPGPFARSYVAAMQNSDYFRIVGSVDERQADGLLDRGEVQFVVTFPPGFNRDLVRGKSPVVLVEADATDPMAANGAISVLNRLGMEVFAPDLPGLERQATPPVELRVHRRFNPEGPNSYNIVPGLMGVILTLTMVLMTGLAMTRERERGTMENLLSMPATPLEIMLGKVLPYLAVGAVQVVVVLVAARAIFGVPFVGALPLLLGGILLFVLALVILGYLISTAARTQMQAMQLTFFFFLPSLMLSGFMFPFRGMPGWAQVLGEIFPLTHVQRLSRGVMLKGAHAATVAGPLAALALFVVLLAGAALLRFRRTLD